MTTHENEPPPDDWSPVAALNAAQSIDATDEPCSCAASLALEILPHIRALAERVQALEKHALVPFREFWCCDQCMSYVTREQIWDMADGEHVICQTCYDEMAAARDAK